MFKWSESADVDIRYIPSTQVPDDDDDDGQSYHHRTRHRAPPTPTQPQLPFTWFHITRRSFLTFSELKPLSLSCYPSLWLNVYLKPHSFWACHVDSRIYLNVSVCRKMNEWYFTIASSLSYGHEQRHISLYVLKQTNINISAAINGYRNPLITKLPISSLSTSC